MENKRIVSPDQVYAAYFQRHNSVNEKSNYNFYRKPKSKVSLFPATDKKDTSIKPEKEEEKLSDKERLTRILKLYKKVSKIIIEKIRSKYIHDDEALKEKANKVINRVLNKLRTDKNGDVFISVNGSIDFSGDEKQYKQYFVSKKENFRKIFREVSKELISSLEDSAPIEKGKTFILGENSE